MSLSPTFHNVLGTLWARFVCHFEKYFYLFISLSHFVRGICFAEVGHKISQWNVVGITFYPVNRFLKHALILLTRIFPYCRKVHKRHNFVNIVTLFAATLWQLVLNFPGICCSNLIFPTFPQLSPNVVETLLQPYIVSWVYTWGILTKALLIAELDIRHHRCSKLGKLSWHSSGVLR